MRIGILYLWYILLWSHLCPDRNHDCNIKCNFGAYGQWHGRDDGLHTRKLSMMKAKTTGEGRGRWDDDRNTGRREKKECPHKWLWGKRRVFERYLMLNVERWTLKLNINRHRLVTRSKYFPLFLRRSRPGIFRLTWKGATWSQKSTISRTL